MDKYFQRLSIQSGLLLILYVAAAALWIFGTDLLIQPVSGDTDGLSLLVSFKDWIFIVLCGLLFLYLVNTKGTAKEDLAESEKRYRLLFEKSLDGIMLTNPNGEILNVNPAGCRILGMEEEEIVKLGRNGLVVQDEKLKNAVEHRDKTGSFSGELTLKHRSGRHIPVELTSSVFINENGERRTSLIFRDITGRKEFERLLEEQVIMRTAVMEIGEKAIESEGLDEFYTLLVHKVKKLLHARAVQLVGLTDRSEIEILADTGEGNSEAYKIDTDAVKELFALNDPELVRSGRFAKPAGGNDAAYSTGIVIPAEDGPIGVLLLHFGDEVELSTGNRLFLKAVAHLVGITHARKTAEMKLQKSLEEKKTLLAEIHHRIKNNLAVISGLLELQASEIPDKNVQFALRDSQRRIHTIATVHEKLYQSESLAEFEFEHFVNDLVNTIKNTFSGDDKAEIEFTIHVDNIELDMEQAVPLGLILNELVSNAYKHAFTDGQKGEVTITFAKEDDLIRLQVTDNGVGLPDDFDIKESNSLGMKLIETLAKQLEGTLDYRNIGTGSEFVVTTPIS